jgi:hypothetical protein
LTIFFLLKAGKHQAKLLFMHFFIDTNIIETDPFWKNKFAKTILEMAKDRIINLYLSRVVLEEIRRHTIRNFNKSSKSFDGALYEYNRYRPINLEMSGELNIEQAFDDFYEKLVKRYHLKILEYKNEFFPIVMERALNRKKPFNDEKTELKDCTIWLTYSDYVQSRMLSDCYLLTNNTKDFCEGNAISEDPTEYKIHSELLIDTKKFRVFPSLRDCFKLVLEPKLTKSKRFREWLDNTYVDSNYVFDLILEHESKKIESAVYREIEKLEVDDVYGSDDYFTGGYCDVEGIEWKNCEQVDIDLIEEDSCIVSCILNMKVRVNGFKYNPGYESGEDKYLDLDEKDIDVQLYISFYLKESDIISSVDVDSVEVNY